MVMGKVYTGTVGLLIELETEKDDLGNATVTKILVQKPDGSAVSWDATVSGTTLQYTTQPGDLDTPGLYRVQAYAEYPDGSKYYGETAKLPVFEHFE